ncbi:Inositol-1,4,5-trisphosphate 5-phosphatase 1 [Coemansia spiralis]|uniref:phosphoinositide 5-phosphatase n=2 Tax=Coemansia TaxID=4863 RepID=A0A9W8L0L0_9FUNG|nr:Endonuclease/exonuclease/phosphatase [Coemansia spiralis]KAJ1990700.1 Inositol-1,4,5-trisphosphate 5-phosphatase 1 [Coemansia umbellata]KAJ2621618.1 Inositol-1,4,5-trisphosphate 5-phosphatase 1 [Coemansia sp. RSA 1358]KAJ2680135.1 Inositol-1,4,5-trisphosphate 5-phosphatase 1 [Coemansia spiralis]
MEHKRFFVYVRPQPRIVALVPVHALSNPNGTFMTVQLAKSSNGADSDVKVKIGIELVERMLQYFSPLDMEAVYGCAGILDYQADTYIYLITRCQSLCDLGALTARGAGKPISRVTQVISLSLTDSIFDASAYRRMPGAMHDDVLQGEMDPYGMQNPCIQMTQFLGNGAFYFSPFFDITRTMQSQRLRAVLADDPEIYDPDPKFQWNNNMLQVFTEHRMNICGPKERQVFDTAGYAVSLIQGCASVFYAGGMGNSRGAELAVYLISRSSSMRSGMRFLTRGVDDEGGVANEVETEVIMTTRSLTLSHVQVRGSIPVFWTQDGIQIGSHKVSITRSTKATLPATKRHFSDLLNRYKRVNVVNLLKIHYASTDFGGLGAADPGMAAHGAGSSEADLGRFYNMLVNSMGLPKSLVSYNAFDYNTEVRGGHFERVNSLIDQIHPLLADFKYYLEDNESGNALCLQYGVQRTNCIDCLDRTNVVQSVISRSIFSDFLQQNNIVSRGTIPAVIDGLGRLWGDNGNAISRLYTGTGALKADVTTSGKSGWAGFLSDASKSISRLMQNSFQDKGKQSVIDLLLASGDSGLYCRPVSLYDPYESEIKAALEAELPKISRKDSIQVMLCTYNLHGSPYRGEPLGTWLTMPQDKRPDFIAIGFQEVVNLDVQSVISADTTNRRVWEQVLTSEINAQYKEAMGNRADGEYALVSSEQLVGVALLFFAHDTIIPRIHNVQMAKCKTGLAGMTGNKGCVAMQLMLDDTSICIVAAHLAAGATNVAERNSDFHTIRTGTRFRRGKPIDDNDYVFWLGDLNYRIDLPNDQTRRLISQREIQSLMMYDQLSTQMAAGKVFRGYMEPEVLFPPTYKFDPGTSNYDTSEKMRVPSWTDRIMYRGKNVKVLAYYRDEICFSDHKPVLAMMNFNVISIDKEQKRQILRKLYARRHEAEKLAPKEQKLIDWDAASVSESISPSSNGKLELPAPSSDSYVWWDNDGLANKGPGAVNSRNGQLLQPGTSLINPFSGARSTVNIIQSGGPSSFGISANQPSTTKQYQQPNVLDDPFADNGANISWEPILPT